MTREYIAISVTDYNDDEKKPSAEHKQLSIIKSTTIAEILPNLAGYVSFHDYFRLIIINKYINNRVNKKNHAKEKTHDLYLKDFIEKNKMALLKSYLRTPLGMRSNLFNAAKDDIVISSSEGLSIYRQFKFTFIPPKPSKISSLFALLTDCDFIKSNLKNILHGILYGISLAAGLSPIAAPPIIIEAFVLKKDQANDAAFYTLIIIPAIVFLATLSVSLYGEYPTDKHSHIIETNNRYRFLKSQQNNPSLKFRLRSHEEKTKDNADEKIQTYGTFSS